MSVSEDIISHSPVKMQNMLKSVKDYNESFSLKKQEKELLEKILFAISIIDREFFVSDSENAYDDNALPIGEGQTISQPSTVARMLLLADLKEGDSVLEVGTGSGWNASLISLLVYPGHVSSAERHARLIEQARKNLSELRSHLKQKAPHILEKISKINFYIENLFEKGAIWKRRYNKIIITAGIMQGEEDKIKNIAENLLEEGGILLCPYTSGPLLILKKKKGAIEKSLTKEHYVFVPLLE